MRRLISSITYFFTWPFRILKKSRIDNFVGGLIFGAVFSLVVNIATVQLQEVIQKQRILEAVENEIVTNAIRAGVRIEQNENQVREKQLPNYYHTPLKYISNVWQNSEAIKYTVELDPEIQGEIQIYYSSAIESANELVELDYRLQQSRLSDCYFSFEQLEETQKETCLEIYQTMLLNEADTAESVLNNSYNLLKKFHPTKDRLSNPLLRLLLGDKAMVVRSGKK